MDIQEVRRAVLRTLIKTRHGNVARQFALAVRKPDGQINDMLATPPRKSFGERIARALERAYTPEPLPAGYFDDIANASTDVKKFTLKSPDAPRYSPFSEPIAEVIELMQALDVDGQREIVGAVRLMHAQLTGQAQNSTKRAGQ